MKNKLYFGDNLDILRDRIPDESVDLVYLDPPFNSNASYNVLFKERSGKDSAAQIVAFDDTWRWGMESELAYKDIISNGSDKVVKLISGLREFLGQNDMMAYLVMMTQRIVELRRVLKPTGSIYLHCDPTASHYIKLVMDAVFGAENYRNEIIWRIGWVSGFKTQKRGWIRNHDTLLYYLASEAAIPYFNKEYIPYPEGYVRRDGKPPTGKGIPIEDTWNSSSGDVLDSIMIKSFSVEKLGYPTQKPEALLERIIKASSNEGDVVLDPFCGCGTSIAAAEKLNRRWIGIDITHLAITLIKHRLNDAYGSDVHPFEIDGVPVVVEGARELAREDRFKFEWWALGLVDARPVRDRKKGADGGVDGFINFFDDNSGKHRRIVVQVKSGGVKRSDIATLRGDMEREKAEIALFVTLEPPTKPMVQEALQSGFYTPEAFPNDAFPRVQILTIEDLLNGKKAEYPRYAPSDTFKQAPRQRKKRATQSGF